MILPQALIDNISNIYGASGKIWLKRLPSLLAKYASVWHLEVGICYAAASFNFVAPVTVTHGYSTEQAVIKSGIDEKTFLSELNAVQHFAGNGCVKLLKADVSDKIMLLECIIPGGCLEGHSKQEERIAIAANMLDKLHKPYDQRFTFPTLRDWFNGLQDLQQRFQGGTGPFPAALISQAIDISSQLLNSMTKIVLLHGDLHYGNIVFDNTRGWLSIDPKGVIGEPEYETPLPRLNGSLSKKEILHNVDSLVEITGFDKSRIYAWIFCKALLAAWWSFEDRGEIYAPFLGLAKMMSKKV